jgi:carbon monoxide dehydrogenase subunit G|tara:strand:- start:8547 stop:8963 length:417 start_codon:yes stop_codon:yes gene_type:complete
MVEIKASIMINSTLDKIWNLISDINNEPEFWKGTKSIRNISQNGNTTKREITIAFKDKKCLQDVTLYPKEKVEAIFTEGIINGRKTVSIHEIDNGYELEAIWDIKLSGMMGMFTGMIKKHIQSGTEQALTEIKREVEN